MRTGELDHSSPWLQPPTRPPPRAARSIRTLLATTHVSVFGLSDALWACAEISCLSDLHNLQTRALDLGELSDVRDSLLLHFYFPDLLSFAAEMGGGGSRPAIAPGSDKPLGAFGDASTATWRSVEKGSMSDVHRLAASDVDRLLAAFASDRGAGIKGSPDDLAARKAQFGENKFNRRVLVGSPELAMAVVVRGGADVQVPVDELVVGDIIRLRHGARVLVDGVILDVDGAERIGLDQSSLTGESIPVERGAHCVVYADTVVVAQDSVSVRVLVCAVGPNTELGRISVLISR